MLSIGKKQKFVIPRLRILGLTFFSAWCNCVFFAPAVFIRMSDPLSSIESARFVFLGAMIVTLMIAVVLKRKIRELFSYRIARIVSPVLMSVGTLLLYVSGFGQGYSFVLIGAGSFSMGIGGATAVLLWGGFYSALTIKESRVAIPLSILLSILIYIGSMSLPEPVNLILIACLPVLSGIFMLWGRLGSSDKEFWREIVDIPTEDDSRSAFRISTSKTSKDKGFEGAKILIPWRSAITTAILWVAFGVMWAIWVSAFMYVDMFEQASIFMILVVAVILLAIVIFLVIFAYQVDYTNVFWWAIPLIVLGFTFIPFATSGWRILAICCVFMAKPMMDMQIWMHFSAIAHLGKASPTQLFGWGWLVIFIGELVGSIFGIVALSATRGEGLLSVSLIVVNIIVVALLVMMLIVNKVRGGKERQVEIEKEKDTLESECRCIAEKYSLTARETEILILLAKGRNRPYIVDKLSLSRNTVNTHTRHIYEKMGIHSRQEFLDFLEKK